MHIQWLCISLLIAFHITVASYAESEPFKAELDEYITRIAHLLTDPYAFENRDARTVHVLENDEGAVLAAVTFVIVGSGSGWTWDQYLAVFRGWDMNLDEEDIYLIDFPRNPEKKANNPYGIHLLDFIRIGGKVWRAFDGQISSSSCAETGCIVISLAMKECGPDDAVNFPTRPAIAQFHIQPLHTGSRLRELEKKRKADAD